MSYYGGTVTVAGRNLITSLMAGKTIEFTRIMADRTGTVCFILNALLGDD